ncbi:MAG: P-loop NTPase fold protein [Opitutaceae bacterium]|nr:P-loop NTPase fold protein [Opitutaceae bacterium]
MSTTFPDLAADRPLDDPSADTLGRVAFADRVAAELLAWKGREHIIVSLNGDAGSGKTTLKNFIRHKLTVSTSPAAAAIAEFNPWHCRTRDDMPRTLATEIADQLERQKEISGAVELAAAWRRLASALSGSADDSAAPAVRAACDSIREQLRALPVPLILFVDDLDRVSPAEIQAVLRWLKTNGAFPNFICFVLYARANIVHALDDGLPGGGAESLRKIVQVELELPEAPEALLRGQLEKGLLEILDAATFPIRSRERWSDVFAAAVWPLFSTPRDVKRFLSAFAFQFAGHFEPRERVLEVNPIDLVALETLRMFVHAVYLELRDMFRRRETRLVRLMSGRDEERKEARLEIDQLLERLPLSAREKRTVETALQHLLPLGTGGVNGCRDDWDRDLRLCSPRHSERYFHLGAITSAVPAHRLIELVRAMGDRTKLGALLRQTIAENVLPEVLERLPALIPNLSESHAAASASAFSDLCDQLPATAPEDMEGRVIRLACDLFGRLQNPLKRENVMTELLDDPGHLTGPILLLQQMRPRSDVPAGVGTTSLSVEQFRRVVKPAAARLQASANDGSIWRSREYGSLIRRWWEWSENRDEVRQWLLEQVKEPEHAQAWLHTFLAPSPTAQPKEMMLQLEDLGQFCDPTLVATAAAKATSSGMDRAAARALMQALSPKGTSAGFALRTLVVKLDEAA